MKDVIVGSAAVIGGCAAWLVGGFDVPLVVLIVCMAIDYLTGLAVAGIFHTSPKSNGGGLDSKIGWAGLARKVVTLLIVVLGHMIDLLLGVDCVRSAAIIGFCANECLSVVENAGLMGLPIPEVITESVSDLMHKKEDDGNG